MRRSVVCRGLLSPRVWNAGPGRDRLPSCRSTVISPLLPPLVVFDTLHLSSYNRTTRIDVRVVVTQSSTCSRQAASCEYELSASSATASKRRTITANTQAIVRTQCHSVLSSVASILQGSIFDVIPHRFYTIGSSTQQLIDQMETPL